MAANTKISLEELERERAAARADLMKQFGASLDNVELRHKKDNRWAVFFADDKAGRFGYYTFDERGPIKTFNFTNREAALKDAVDSGFYTHEPKLDELAKMDSWRDNAKALRSFHLENRGLGRQDELLATTIKAR